VPLLDLAVYSATSTTPLGVALTFNLFTLILFPQANIYVATILAIVLGFFVWVAVSLLTAAIPRIGGDYTINSRILHPWLGFGGSLCNFVSASIAGGLVAYWAVTQGIAPVLTVIGSTTGSSRLVRWGGYFAPDHHNVVFVSAIIVLLILSSMAMLGTRRLIRAMTILFLVAFAGLVVDMVILLFTSHASFVSTVDDFAGKGTFQKTVAAGAKAGLYPDHGYSTKNTIGGIYYALGVSLYVFWGFYLAAEFKGAGRRQRQLKAIVGPGLVQGTLLVLGTWIFLSTVGYNFLTSALYGNYTGPGGSAVGEAGYSYFASIVANNSVVVVILSLAFLGWWLPATNINLVAAQRSLMAWSFDGLTPRKISEVNETTHTPNVAIGVVFVLCVLAAAWVSYSSNFFQVFAIMVLFAYFPVILLGASAMLMRRRRPELYNGSSAEWHLGGVTVLPIVGAVTSLVGIGAIALALYFHENLGITYFHLAEVAPIIVFAVAAVWWKAALNVRRGEGVDLSLTYSSIPPD
jgi:amino acid transporter